MDNVSNRNRRVGVGDTPSSTRATARCAKSAAELPPSVQEGPGPPCVPRLDVGPSGGQPALRFEVQPEYIGCYRILDKIGEGGMGLVYRAEQEEPVRRRVALKVLKAGMDTREVLARFEAERHMLALMDHPNIARALDAGETALGRPYFVMELIGGEPITKYCDRYSLPIPDRLSLFIPVCRAIQHAHHKGVIHRDLKPSNILVTLVDGSPVAKIIDFGIAKATNLSVNDGTFFTRHGQMIGTPEYMSPEQADNTGLDVDTRTDVYSLGVVLYELLTGATPFDPKSFRVGWPEIQRILRDVEPVPPSKKVASIPESRSGQTARRDTDTRARARQLREDLDWIVLKAMSKDRTRRYETADALAEDISRYLRDEPVMAGPPSAMYRLRKLARRNRAKLALTAAIAFGVVMASGALAFALVASNRQQKAELEQSEASSSFLANILASVDAKKKGRSVTLLEVLDKSEASIGSQFAGQPSAEAAVRTTFGNWFKDSGLYVRAEPHLKRALRLCTQLYGEDSDRATSCRFSLADSYRSEGRFDEAREQYQAVIDITRRSRSEDHPDALLAMNSLASLEPTLAHPHRLAEREAMARSTLDLARRTLGEEHPTTLTSMQTLAEVLGAGRPESMTLCERAIEISRTIRGDYHPQTIGLLRTLGWLHFSLGQNDQAESAFRRALAGARATWDDTHPETLTLIADLGMTQKSQGRLEEVEARYLAAIESARRDLGPDHPTTLDLRNNLGQLYRREGRRDDAIRELREVFDANRRLQGEEHVWTLGVMRNLGMALKEGKLYGEAESLLREAVEISRRLHGDEWHYTLSSLSCLASLYHDQNRYEEAERLYLDAIGSVQRDLGPDHPSTLDLRRSLAQLYRTQGRLDDAIREFGDVFAIRRRLWGEKQILTLWAMRDLGVAYKERGLHAEAEPLLEGAVGISRELYGNESRYTRETIDLLASLYHDQGRYEEETAIASQTPESDG